jgi:O-methyltransferase
MKAIGMNTWFRHVKDWTKHRLALALGINELKQEIAAMRRISPNWRWQVIREATMYLATAQIPGDYLEFGVYTGSTFAYACNIMGLHFKHMRFIAFDSFEGLPEPKGKDVLEDGYTSHFYQGQYQCSEDQFIENLRAENVDMSRVQIVKGWYDETLRSESVVELGIDKVAAAFIDCDFYESTVPALEFLTHRMSVGTILMFDDWRCYRNLPDYGVQLAVREWLEKNPHIKLSEIMSFGWHGLAFTVASC